MLTWWGIETRNSFYSFYSCSKTPNPGRLYTIRTSWLQNYEITPKWLGQVECWVLSVECWVLPNGLKGASLIQHSTFNTQRSTLNLTFNTQHSTFNLTFNIQHSTLNSTFNIQHSTFNIFFVPLIGQKYPTFAIVLRQHRITLKRKKKCKV